MRKLALISFLFFITANLYPQSSGFDSTVTAGIKQIYDIKFGEAEQTFNGLIKKYPDKPQGKFFFAMVDWWKIMLDPDNEKYDDDFIDKLDSVIDQCDEILDKDENNLDAIFFKGGALGFRGRLRAFRESWFKAASDAREALPLVERAAKLDPQNVDVKLGFGIYDYYAAVIPESYPVVKPLMLFLPSGNKQRGLKELKSVADSGRYAKYEARYFLMSLYYVHEDNPYEAKIYAKMLTKDFPDNPVFERWLGRTYAKSGNFARASEIFKDVLNKADKKYTGYNTFNTMRESAYYVGYRYKELHKLDSAAYYFRKCVDYSKRIDKSQTSGFQINALLFLGYINDMWDNRPAAVAYYKKVLDLRDYGDSHTLAERYLKKPYSK